MVLSRFLLSIVLSLLLSFADVSAAGRKNDASSCGKYLSDAKALDHSVPRGLLRHGEHLVDLVLAQAGSMELRHLTVFKSLVHDLVDAIVKGRAARVNEKIDGSPSIALGFLPANDGAPFVAYKGAFFGKKQLLLASSEQARRTLDGPLARLYGNAISLFGPRMRLLSAGELQEYVFQGDLLFSPDDGRMHRTDDEILISANTVVYRVPRGSEYFDRLRHAKIGVVIHTVGKRVVDGNGRIAIAPAADAERGKLAEFVQRLNSNDVFAIHPWRDDVALSPASTFAGGSNGQVGLLLDGIASRLAGLSPEFKHAWSSRHEKRFRVFFNSFLKPPSDGGVYLSASRQEPIDVNRLLSQFAEWLAPRVAKGTESPLYARQADAFLTRHRAELESVLAAYYDAVRIQYLLMPHLESMFRSKLGGGGVEGIMLETSDAIVKLVDRLDFTMSNNRRWNRGEAVGAAPTGQRTRFALPEPFDEWRPGASFVIMKGQPVHSGHLKMIKRALARNPRGDVFVVLSDRGPNLAAAHWKELKVANTKKELLAKDYTYIFDERLRRGILEAGLGEARARIHFSSPSLFWSYLDAANAAGLEGKVQLVVGSKEVDEQRYDDQLAKYGARLELLPIELQHDGISGTMVRGALRDYAEGDGVKKRKAMEFLERAFSEVENQSSRDRLLREMIDRWATVDKAVGALLGLPR